MVSTRSSPSTAVRAVAPWEFPAGSDPSEVSIGARRTPPSPGAMVRHPPSPSARMFSASPDPRWEQHRRHHLDCQRQGRCDLFWDPGSWSHQSRSLGVVLRRQEWKRRQLRLQGGRQPPSPTTTSTTSPATRSPPMRFMRACHARPASVHYIVQFPHITTLDEIGCAGVGVLSRWCFPTGEAAKEKIATVLNPQ